MKRNLALILASCLAISPLSAACVPMQTFASEQAENEADTAFVTVVVSDENGLVLASDAEYAMTAGATCSLKAEFGETEENASYTLLWSSETPSVVSIDDEGLVKALTPGEGQITLDVMSEEGTFSFCYPIIVSEPEASKEASEEAATEAVTEEAAEVVAEETAVETATEETTEETTEGTIAEISEESAAAEAEATAPQEIDGATAETAAIEEAAIENAASAAAEEAVEGEAAIEAEAEAATAADPAALVAPDGSEPLMIVEADATMITTNAAATVTVTKGRNVTPGWVNENGNWSYIQSDGTKATGFLTLGTSTFYLDAQGMMQTGWIKNGSDYIYADSEGRLLTGWQTIGGSIYYLDPTTFARKTGICKINSKLYAFDANGKRQTGPRWYNSSSGKCFVYGNGTLHTGWLQRGDKWYYLNSNGILRTGKFVYNKKIYFLDRTTGAMRTGWYSFGSYIYYLNSNGEAVKGWQTIGGRKYYFDSNCLAKIGWYKPGNRVYYFDSRGKMQTGLVQVGSYIYFLRSDGIVTKGWKKINGKWYYLNARSRCLTGWLELDGKKYHFNKYGVMDTGHKSIGGVKYYFGSDGALVPSTNSYSNTQEFIECIAPLIIKYAPQWGVKVYSPIIAQAILESASGQSSLGKKYNNFFGLKCGTLWTGPSVNLATGEEYTPGTYTTIYANFRVFSNMEEGVKGYFEFLFKGRDRYDNLIGETDPYRYLEKIKADGYATSSHYVQNTYNVITSYNLTRFDP